MNITTKFKLGDKAFRLYHNRVQEVEIVHLQVNVKPIKSPVTGTVVKVCYTLENINDSPRDCDNYEYEASLFATKAELLASL